MTYSFTLNVKLYVSPFYLKQVNEFKSECVLIVFADILVT